MENHPLYTRKYFSLDARVWITLAVVILASLVLMGYTRIYNKQDLKCPSIQIFVNSNPDIENLTYHINEPISFRSNVEPSDEVEWDFADGTHERGPIAIHSFKQPGNYKVRATVNNRCPYEQIITIIPDIEMPENSGMISESIIGQAEVNVGVEANYETFLEAEDYEWYIQNNRTYPRQKGSSARFTFISQGNYVLVLQLNNGKEYMKEIIVYKKDGNSGATWLTPVPLLPPEPKKS